MHTPNTVMPVSFTSMAQVPTNTLMTRQHTDTVGGRTSSVKQTPTLLKKVTEKGQVSYSDCWTLSQRIKGRRQMATFYTVSENPLNCLWVCMGYKGCKWKWYTDMNWKYISTEKQRFWNKLQIKICCEVNLKKYYLKPTTKSESYFLYTPL